ncbi:MAG: CBS domain-containing protein [Phycisphaeraceae bacterium]|nr:MAG: CBS domain-containing protein [Phycisphaeraceae bacterium]
MGKNDRGDGCAPVGSPRLQAGERGEGMPNAERVLHEKQVEGRGGIHTIRPDATVLDAAEVMNRERIGSVVVVDANGQLAGIFTERDILTRVIADERRPQEIRVGDVMTTPVACCEPRTPLEELRTLMRQKRVRHVPVVDQGRVVGMISIGDLNAAEAQVMIETISYLERYMYQP